MADNLVFEESLNTEIDSSEFISKKWVYVNDNNNGNYTSQVVIDSTPLANSGGWVNWSEGFIVMPLIVQLTSATAASLPAGSSVSDYSWAFKNGFWQMINSMTVEFNNQNIIQQTPFLNVFRSFKCLSSWSKDDLENHGSSCGVYPDSSDSWSYCNDFYAGGAAGALFFNSNGVNIPLTNNRNCKVMSSTTTPAVYTPNAETLPISEVVGVPTQAVTNYTYGGPQSTTDTTNALIYGGAPANIGMLERQKGVLYNTSTTASNMGLGQVNLNDDTSCNDVYRNSKVSALGCHSWKIYAKLRLKDLADFFDKSPLLKGSTMRFYINTNQSKVQFTSTKAVLVENTSKITTNATLSLTDVSVIGGLSCPLIIASNQLGQGGSALPAAGTSDTFELSVSIYRNTFSQSGAAAVNTSLTACRLYAPVYTFNPIAESKYLSLAPTKRVKYNDIFQYQFNNVAKGPFNFLVSNGISNIQSVLVVPFLSQSAQFTNAAGSTSATPAYNQQLNPFNTTPSMPDPIMLTNFNILISGVNLFLNNENYDYEAFCTQLAQSNQLNGGLTTGLASGLISEKMFSQAYRYYYGNASRHLPSEDGVSRSVQIVGVNASLRACDLMVFVEFQKEVVIDVATGARLE
jgi:hypothetical protein